MITELIRRPRSACFARARARPHLRVAEKAEQEVVLRNGESKRGNSWVEGGGEGGGHSQHGASNFASHGYNER